MIFDSLWTRGPLMPRPPPVVGSYLHGSNNSSLEVSSKFVFVFVFFFPVAAVALLLLNLRQLLRTLKMLDGPVVVLLWVFLPVEWILVLIEQVSRHDKMTSWPDEPCDDSRPSVSNCGLKSLLDVLVYRSLDWLKCQTSPTCPPEGCHLALWPSVKKQGKTQFTRDRQSSMATYTQPSTRQLCRLLVDNIHTTDISHTLNVVARVSSTTGCTVLHPVCQHQRWGGWENFSRLPAWHHADLWPVTAKQELLFFNHIDNVLISAENILKECRQIVTASRSQHLCVTQKVRKQTSAKITTK